MQKVICSWIGAKWFTPVMVHAKQPPFVYYWQCIWGIDIYHIHNPYLLIFQRCCKPKAIKHPWSIKLQIVILLIYTLVTTRICAFTLHRLLACPWHFWHETSWCQILKGMTLWWHASSALCQSKNLRLAVYHRYRLESYLTSKEDPATVGASLVASWSPYLIHLLASCACMSSMGCTYKKKYFILVIEKFYSGKEHFHWQVKVFLVHRYGFKREQLIGPRNNLVSQKKM